MRIAVASEKGGVGKTTVAVNLAEALAVRGHRVLLIDLDPQGAASAWLGHRSDGAALRSALDGEARELPIVATGVECIGGLDLVAAGRALVGLDRSPAPGAELVLRQLLDRAGDRWRFVLMDSPPSMGLASVAALAAASVPLVPVEPSPLAVEGVVNVIRTIELVRDRLNPELAQARLLVAGLDRRASIGPAVVEHMRATYGLAVCKTEIRIDSKLREAPSHAKPIRAYASYSRAVEDFAALAVEVEGWKG